MTEYLQLIPLSPQHFAGVITLGNEVHGEGYLSAELMQQIYTKSVKGGVNSSFVMLDTSAADEKVVGFRLTYAPTHWQVDEWCSPELWKLPIEKLCYFKSSTVNANYRAKGIARRMLEASIAAAKQQGAEGGICHTWMQSPGNAAYYYFIRCGGQHVKTHPDRWLADSLAGYQCVVCTDGPLCHCDAGEMILYFDPKLKDKSE